LRRLPGGGPVANVDVTRRWANLDRVRHPRGLWGIAVDVNIVPIQTQRLTPSEQTGGFENPGVQRHAVNQPDLARMCRQGAPEVLDELPENHLIKRVVEKEDVFVRTRRVRGHVSFNHVDGGEAADSPADDVDVPPRLIAERLRKLDADDPPEIVLCRE